MRFRLEPVKWLIIVAEILLLVFIGKTGFGRVRASHYSYAKTRTDAELYSNRHVNVEDLKNRVTKQATVVNAYHNDRDKNLDQTVLLSRVQKVADQSGIKRIETIRPLDDFIQDQIVYKQLDMSISGEYTSAMRFINSIEKETPPFLIKSLVLKPISQSTQYIVTAKFTIIQASVIQ